MHIGIEVKKDDIFIVYVSGTKETLTSTRESKLHIDNESIKSLVDFRKNLSMLFAEEKVDHVSLVEGSADSSKMRVNIEYLISEVCYLSEIALDTFSSPHMSKLKEKTFEAAMGVPFKEYYKRLPLHSYSANAFAVAWRFA